MAVLDSFGSQDKSTGAYKPSQTTEFASPSWDNSSVTNTGKGTYTVQMPSVKVTNWLENPRAFADLSKRYKVRLPGTRPDNDEPILIWGRAASLGNENFHGNAVTKDTELVRVTNPNDPNQYVDVLRIKRVSFVDSFNRTHSFSMNW